MKDLQTRGEGKLAAPTAANRLDQQASLAATAGSHALQQPKTTTEQPVLLQEGGPEAD